MVGFSHFCVVGVSPPPVPSSIYRKSFQPSVALYLLIVPFGTYNVALLNVSSVKILDPDVLPSIANGFSINEIILVICVLKNALPPILVKLLPRVMEVRFVQSQKASFPILVTLLGMVMEVRPVQSWYLQLIVNQSIIS